MKTLFQPSAVAEVKARLQRLRPDSQRVWGKMTVAQALAHCAKAFEAPLGEHKPPRMALGRMIGWIIKPLALGNAKPMRRNTPTVPGLTISDKRDFEAERRRLIVMIDRFVSAGPSGLSQHPHSFFGRLTADEWGVLAYKHLDHHLRQFGG